jgi:hypothetical protein
MNRTCVATVRESAMYPRFSELEILQLQDLFLIYGCHYLTVPTMAYGRAIISLFLESLRFSRVGCLTTSSSALPSFVAGLHDELAFEGALAFDHHLLDEFLLNTFYYDFVWIECTEDLLKEPWFYYFEQKLHNYNLGASMPIVFVSYKDAAI